MEEQVIKVYKCYCQRIDLFLYIQSFHEAEDVFKMILRNADGVYNNRSSYMDFVVKICVQEYLKIIQPRIDDLMHRNKYAEIGKLKEALYRLCIGVNPEMAIDKHCFLMQKAVIAIRQKKAAETKAKMCDNNDLEQILDLERKLKQRLIGQDDAIVKVVHALKRASAGLKYPHKPIATFMFLGNTGIGKTEMAKTLSLKYFGSESHLITINCSEFEAKHEYAKLIGSPPGFVGYNEGSFLAKAIKDKPKCVLLFDEIEKANASVHKLILRILDEGKLRDGKGEMIIFNQAIIIMTSNVSSHELARYQDRIGFYKSNDEVGIESICRSALQKKFQPEFINRINEIVVFKPLKKEFLLKIFNILFGEYILFLMEKNIDVLVSDEVAEFIVDHSSCELYGARELQRSIDSYILDPLADMIVGGKIFSGDEVQIACQNEKIIFEIEKCEERI